MKGGIFVKRSITAWVVTVIVILLLYLGAVALFANRIHPTILGMPFLYAWYVLVPLLNPVALGLLYIYDRRHNPQNDPIHWTEGS
ncbi:hypothetical protein AN477_03595 [Alicyclobacillus ferrooxydans]|uniref:DUF3311 domain-containing protein n=1 Tax=Alicyclobacillus ferrooxydans TaxID=471514 RepID=A0A0P9D738_9BACL|nr:hypothetical protein AN477_03595 [Alicyclobacillus ferrooxydans]